jgi:hypothetical protein
VLELANSIDDQLRNQDNIKANLTDIERKSMDCVCVAQRAISWRSAVMLMDQNWREISVVCAALLIGF